MTTKLVSWNVNGLRACVGKGFLDFFREADADVFCIQESKLQAGQIDLELEGYRQYWSYAEKKGYSGTAVFSRREPLSVTTGIGEDAFDREGRAVTLEFPEYFLVNLYSPNSQRGLTRLEERMFFEDRLREYLKGLDGIKPVIFCGDLNVAHREIDLKNPAANRKNAGFTDEERDRFDRLLREGYIDTFRHFFPDRAGAYTWWSYMFQARQNNAGWRIDYFCVSERWKDRLVGAEIHSEVMGSDHCPVSLIIR